MNTLKSTVTQGKSVHTGTIDLTTRAPRDDFEAALTAEGHGDDDSVVPPPSLAGVGLLPITTLTQTR
jgi:hypothetical protein